MTTVGIIQKLVGEVGPYFIRNKHIGTFLESVAMTYDSAIESLDLGLRLAQPLRCDASALPYLSNDRGIKFYPTEVEISKRYRLTQWKQLHRRRGCHIGEMKHAQPYFLPDVPLMRIVHQSGEMFGGSSFATWHTLDANGVYSKYKVTPSNWNWDGQASKWSRFWAIVYVPSRLTTLPKYGDDHHYGDGTIYAGASTDQIAKDLVDMIKSWKASHSRLSGYIIATDPSSFDPTSTAVDSGHGWTTLPTGNWGQPIDSTGKRTRLPGAVWIYDTRSN